MLYDNEQIEYFQNLKSYINELSEVGGKNKLIFTFLLIFGVCAIFLSFIGILFTISWVFGLISTLAIIGFIGFFSLIKFLVNGRNH